jgi:hypothetical protein
LVGALKGSMPVPSSLFQQFLKRLLSGLWALLQRVVAGLWSSPAQPGPCPDPSSPEGMFLLPLVGDHPRQSLVGFWWWTGVEEGHCWGITAFPA